MKLFTNKKLTQKIIIALVTVIVLNFSVPIQSNASVLSTFADIGGDLLKEVVQLIASVGDVVMGALNHFMLGTSQLIGSSMLDKDDPNITDATAGSDLYAASLDTSKDVQGEIPEDYEFDGLIFTGGWKIPNFLYCPENIFSNKIAMLDVNFINPHTYTPVEYKDKVGGQATESSIDKSQSASEYTSNEASENKKTAGETLRSVIASWYKAFRNIAIVGLLIVLVYLGIRIMISSTAVDKAKYKENLNDWLVALCLVVIIHFIMAGIMMFVDSITSMLSNANKGIYVEVEDSEGTHTNEAGKKVLSFRTNLTGYIRFMAQSKDFGYCTAYTIIYLALVIYTCMFTVTYFKRFLYMAFFTMIAPLVALSYPIDKLRDGKAQAFELWFKEYTLNAIIQPVHLVLYTVFVGSAMDLVVGNPIYAIVAIGFLTPAEKFIKKMFGFDRAQTAGGLGEIAGGALAYSGMKQLAGHLTGKKGKSDGKGSSDSGSEEKATIRQANKDYWKNTDPYEIAAGVNPNDNLDKETETQKETDADSNVDTEGSSDSEGKTKKSGENTNRNPNENEEGEQEAEEDEQEETIEEQIQREKKESHDNPDAYWSQRTDDLKDKLAKKSPGTSKDRIEQLANEKINDEKAESKKNPDTYWKRRASNLELEREEKEQQKAKENDKNKSIPDILAAGAKQPTRLQKFKSGVANSRFAKGTGAVASSGLRKIRRATIDKVSTPEARRKTIYKAAKSGLRGAAKVGGMAMGATALGVAGMAAGVATGDFSKGVSTALGAASLGASVGGNLGTKYGQKMTSTIDSVKQTYEQGAYSEQDLKERKQKEFDREWKNKEDNYKYLRSKGMNDKKAREFLNSERTQEFLDAGITDIKMIHKAGKLADDKGYSTKQAVAKAKIASGLSDDFATNDSARNAFVKTASRHITDKSQIKALEDDMITLKE